MKFDGLHPRAQCLGDLFVWPAEDDPFEYLRLATLVGTGKTALRNSSGERKDWVMNPAQEAFGGSAASPIFVNDLDHEISGAPGAAV